MRNLTQEVMHSINNHRNSTAQVVNSSEEINVMVVDICEAAILQAGSSQQISSSLDAFEESTNGQLTSALVMDEVMSKLLCQVAVLQKEIEEFQIK
jgi:methyl-accepting chemotaxis protein